MAGPHVDTADVVKIVQSFTIVTTINTHVSLNENTTAFHSRQNRRLEQSQRSFMRIEWGASQHCDTISPLERRTQGQYTKSWQVCIFSVSNIAKHSFNRQKTRALPGLELKDSIYAVYMC